MSPGHESCGIDKCLKVLPVALSLWRLPTCAMLLFCQCLPVFLFTIIPHPGRPALLTRESCFLISKLYFSRPPGVDASYLSNMLFVHLHWDCCQPFWELCITPVKPASFFFYLFYFICGGFFVEVKGNPLLFLTICVDPKPSNHTWLCFRGKTWTSVRDSSSKLLCFALFA